MTTIFASGFNREIHVAELEAHASELNIRSALRFVTAATSFVLSGRADHPPLANLINLPVLAKALSLWSNLANGRSVAHDDVEWLLRACNSLPWYSQIAAAVDPTHSVLGMLFRQAYGQYAAGDPWEARIARAWIMFHELVKQGDLPVADPSNALRCTLGVSAEDLWVLGFAIWSYCATVTSQNPDGWAFNDSEFMMESPRRHQIVALMRQLLERLALSPQELRERYETDSSSKYRDPTSREGYWISEFNILRDFPIIRIDAHAYCAPFPPFVLTRALDGFYFDLVELYADRARKSKRGGNPYDNEMSATLGTLFQRYIGCQLRLLHLANDELIPEFTYGRANKASPDWILIRSGMYPVLIECKARQPTLPTQSRAQPDELREEIRKGLAKACGQLAGFVQAVRAGEKGLERFAAHSRFICVVALYTPVPFHMIPDVRQIIEDEASKANPAWGRVRNQILLVPLSVRELEAGVALEATSDKSFESQLEEYATYRVNARRIERWEGQVPIFPRHFEEYVQERFHDGRPLRNPLCAIFWNLFGEYCTRRLFSPLEEDVEGAARQAVLRYEAYRRWQERSCPQGDDWADWFAAERLLNVLR